MIWGSIQDCGVRLDHELQYRFETTCRSHKRSQEVQAVQI